MEVDTLISPAAVFLVWLGPLRKGIPKGPSRTKNTTTIAKIVNYYAVVFLLRPPNLLRCGPFLERKNVCNSQERRPHKLRRDSKSPRRTKKTTRSKFTTRSLLVRRGPLGTFCAIGCPARGATRSAPCPSLTLQPGPCSERA